MGLCCLSGAFRSVSGSASFRFPLPLDRPPRSVAEDFAAAFIYCHSIEKDAVFDVAVEIQAGKTEYFPRCEMMTSTEIDLSPNVISTCLAFL
jgi:hypothetical protein